jgi:catechol-2,3-dioxygenase
MAIKRLNHAVLWVRDAAASAVFYHDVLGFEIVADMADGKAIFLRADGSTNDHDLGLFTVGSRPPAPERAPGLYHLAWQVHTIDELAELRRKLQTVGALVGESDHGVSKSLYARDIDGIEFEVMWASPREQWTKTAMIAPLDLAGELARWSGRDTADQ